MKVKTNYMRFLVWLAFLSAINNSMISVDAKENPQKVLQQAEAKYQQALKSRGEEAMSLFYEVLDDITGIRNVEPILSEVWMALGYLHRTQDEISEAIDCFEKAIHYTPNNEPKNVYSLLGNAYAAQGNLPKAVEAYKLAQTQNPDDVGVLYHLAFLNERTDHLQEAEASYREAIALLKQHEVSLTAMFIDDQQIWHLLYYSLGRCLEAQGRSDEAYELYVEAAEMGIWEDPFQRYIAPRVEILSVAEPWFDEESSLYPHEIKKLLLKNENEIKREAFEIFKDRKDRLVIDPERLHDKGRWNIFRFIERQDNGTVLWVEENCQLAPITCQMLKSISELTSCAPTGHCDAFFSLLIPGTHIKSHNGPSNLRQRIHLPLQVPSNISETALRVGEEIRNWEIGKILVFDDSFEHEVWHHGKTEERIVLILDIWNPLVSANARQSLLTDFE